MAQIKISKNYWDKCTEKEKDYIQKYAPKYGLSAVKSFLSDVKKNFKHYKSIYGKGYVSLDNGDIHLWNGLDTRKFQKVDDKFKHLAKESISLKKLIHLVESKTGKKILLESLITKEIIDLAKKQAVDEGYYNENEVKNFNAKDMNNGLCDFVAEQAIKKIKGAKFVSTDDISDLDNYHFKTNGHAWITYNGKCYDSEAPNGVKNYTDLPIFKRSKI